MFTVELSNIIKLIGQMYVYVHIYLRYMQQVVERARLLGYYKIATPLL